MTRSSGGRKGAKGVGWVGVLVLVAAVVVLSATFVAAPARAAPSPTAAQPASGSSSEQWAFGGHASMSFSCQDASCFNDSTFVGSYSVSYYVGWVVIYTRTNVSPTQTMIEGQAALNASARLAFSETLNGTTESLHATVSGLATSAGFTNVTDGTVALTSASNATTWTSPALAILNASSHKAFNFSGSYSVQSAGVSASAPFDLGGHEDASVAFSPSLGIVPYDPQPGDTWSAAAPFSASGSWTSGYSISIPGNAQSNWTTGSVARSGVLGVNGTDLGAITLYDNYTSPPKTVTAQMVFLDFGSGVFGLSDGWLIVPSGLYSGVFSALSSTGGSTSSLSNETAYYDPAAGFVGAGIAGDAAVPVAASGSGPFSVSLQAGPEPVNVAEQQYDAMTSSSGSSGGFPGIWLILAVVVVALVVASVVVLIRRRSRTRRPPATAWMPGNEVAPLSPSEPNSGTGPVSPPPPGSG